MAEERINIVYTATDIQKYLEGTMPPAEMHALEKAALDDPFLAEAIEGYEVMKESDLTAPLAELRNKFNEQHGSKLVALKPTKAFRMWKAAAAIFIICSGISLTYLLTNRSQRRDESIAVLPGSSDSMSRSLNKTTQPEHDSAVSNQYDIALEKETQEITLNPQEPTPLQDSAFMYRPSPSSTKSPEAIAGGGYIPDSQNTQQDITMVNTAPGTEQNRLERAEPLNNVTAKAQATESKISDDKYSSVTHTFRAQVVRPDNTPIPFANVGINGKKITTYADVNGYFNVDSPDSLLTVQVESLGYNPRSFILQAQAEKNKIVLTEDDVTANAKTISRRSYALAKSRRPQAVLKDTLMDAEPEDGWNNYNNYFNNSLSLSDKIPKKTKGDFEVSFEVQDNGTITNLKVDKDLCEDCDKELLRIIQEGPKWKVKKGKKGAAKLQVRL